MLRKGLLLDRDGVINVDRGYVGKREQFEFISAVFPFLRAAQASGYRLAILTNQSGVARGFYTADDYEKLTGWMLGELARQGIAIDLVLHCFEHAEGSVAPYNRESFWRKPNPGMVLEAVQRLRLDPARSVFLGDHERDMQAARAGGIGTCLLLGGKAQAEGVKAVKDYDAALSAMRD
jgi:D-glycero-D-manno-heptose 1,7-bisphosphate phosphatase